MLPFFFLHLCIDFSSRWILFTFWLTAASPPASLLQGLEVYRTTRLFIWEKDVHWHVCMCSCKCCLTFGLAKDAGCMRKKRKKKKKKKISQSLCWKPFALLWEFEKDIRHESGILRVNTWVMTCTQTGSHYNALHESFCLPAFRHRSYVSFYR